MLRLVCLDDTGFLAVRCSHIAPDEGRLLHANKFCCHPANAAMALQTELTSTGLSWVRHLCLCGKGGERQHESKPRSVSGLHPHRPH